MEAVRPEACTPHRRPIDRIPTITLPPATHPPLPYPSVPPPLRLDPPPLTAAAATTSPSPPESGTASCLSSAGAAGLWAPTHQSRRSCVASPRLASQSLRLPEDSDP